MSKITEKMVDEWVALYQTGQESCNTIARKYNVYRETVRQYLKKRGIERSRYYHKYKTITMKMIKEWIELYNTGDMNSEDIAIKYGVASITVRKYLKDFGITFSKKTHHKQNYNEIICLYDKNEQLAYCFDSAYEMSKKTGKSYSGILSTLSRYRTGQLSGRMLINGSKYQIRLIEKENEDEV